MRAVFLALATATLATAAPLHAQTAGTSFESQVKGGVDAWGAGNYEAAVRAWEGPAAKGDADAQFNLAQAYRMGKGVGVDLRRAEDLYRKSAQQGHLKAGDNLGLLLFQTGRREEALPWITRSSERGDPRSQYVLGIATFNGDGVTKDWIRAYALMTRASAAGLPQARDALANMDKLIPMKERQLGVSLAGELERQAQTAQGQALAAADLGTTAPFRPSPAPAPVATTPVPPSSATTAGADYAHPVTLPPRAPAQPVHVVGAAVPAPKPAPPRPVAAVPAPRAVAPASGPWRVQFGAFGKKANADALWARLSGRAELSGKSRFDVAAGAVSRLQAGPFASEADARRACSTLVSISGACVVVRN